MRILATPTHETRNERREPDPPRERDRRDAPAGTWQAAQAERQRQAASHLPAPKRQEAAHEQRRAPSAPAGESAAARPDAEGAPHARVEARRGHEDGAGREGGAGGREPAGAVATRAVAAPPPDALEAGLIDAIAAQAPGQDLFELLLPGGERLGVLLAPGGDQVLRILLSCSNAGLRRRLDQKSMELEQGLARRMQQATRLTVL